MKNIVLAILLAIFLPLTASAQHEYAAEGVKTVMMKLPGADFGYPACRLGEAIELSFDVMDNKYERLEYSIRHCDSDFNVDDLTFSEFAEGFDRRTLDESSESFNTLQHFTHYTLTIPNRDVTLTISGNYIITIYNSDDPDTEILTKRFMVYEDDGSIISAHVEQPFLPEYQAQCQQLYVDIDNSRLRVYNPEKYLKVYAIQNGDHNTRRRLNISGFLHEEIQYHLNDGGNIFDGGNEYDFLDAKDVHFRALGIDAILYQNGRYHYVLTPTTYDEAYFNNGDINGAYYIKNDRGFDRDLESDYIDVTFRLKYDAFTDYDIYLYGALTNWQCTPEYKLTWDGETRLWELTTSLKQGLYNYKFAFKDSDGNFAGYSSGNNFNTSNDYLVAVYTTLTRDRGDRLVACKVVK